MKQIKTNDTSSLFTKDEKQINDSFSIANNFSNYFTSIAEIVHSKIKFSNRSFRNLLSSAINDSFIITSTNKEEIYKKIPSLNTSKSCEPNSIQNQISNHLATICNVKLSTGFFPAILKTAKVIPIHKKNSILDPFIHLSDLLTADVLTLTKKKMPNTSSLHSEKISQQTMLV